MEELIKLNFGCGSDYREGWVNLDIDRNVKADVYLKKGEKKLPFKNNSVRYILADNVLEHLSPLAVKNLLKEFERILVPGGRLKIYVPHFTGILTKYLGHYKGYGVNSFCDERDLFDVVKEELILISRCKTAGYKWLRFLNIFNPLFNFGGRGMQQFYEKFLPGGFEEICFIMEVK
jgi:predicted SAM-dependent methyltransferase